MKKNMTTTVVTSPRAYAIKLVLKYGFGKSTVAASCMRECVGEWSA